MATDFAELKEHYGEKEAGSPQRNYLVLRELSSIEESIGKLAALGHRFELREIDVEAEPKAEWPKMLYNPQTNPDGKVFENEAETDDLGEGWLEVQGQVKVPFVSKGLAAKRAAAADDAAKTKVNELPKKVVENPANAKREQQPAQSDGNGGAPAGGGEKAGN